MTRFSSFRHFRGRLAHPAKAADSQRLAAQWDLGGPPPVPDAGTLPWWRIRGLRWVAADLVPLIVFLIVVIIDAADQFATKGTGHKLLYSGMATVFCVWALKLVVQRIRRVSALARAAQSPFTRTRRYVLTQGQSRKDVLLLLFPPDSEARAVPEAALLLASGRLTRRRSGFPADPAGEVDLRADPDHPQDVVPFFDGRPVWPLSPLGRLQTIDPDDPDTAAFLRRFAASSDSAAIVDGEAPGDVPT